jgi:eukaryotic-like serine/threonine-protein kinase
VRRKSLVLFLCVIGLLAACGSTTTTVQKTSAVITRHNQVIPTALLQGSSVGDWPVFGYDPGHTGYVDALVQPHKLTGSLAWSRKFAPIFSSAVAGLGMIYIASTDGYLYALSQSTGAIIWRAEVGNYLTDSTPALEGQTLFVAAHGTTIEALNARTGAQYWTFAIAERIEAPPLVVGSRVLVASRTTLWTLNATNGSLLWKFHRGAVSWPSSGSPAVAGDTVYFGLGSDTHLWALDLTSGQVIWSFDTGDRITSTPLESAGTLYVATWHGEIFALDRLHGTMLWLYTLNGKTKQSLVDGVGGSMALAAGKLYVGDYRGELICLDGQHGHVLWRFATGGQVLATPVVAAGLVYIGSDDGYFYALNIQSGRPDWRYTTGEVRSAATLAAGRLFVGSLNGTIYAFK